MSGWGSLSCVLKLEQFIHALSKIGGQLQGQFRGRYELAVLDCEYRLAGYAYGIGQILLGNP